MGVLAFHDNLHFCVADSLLFLRFMTTCQMVVHKCAQSCAQLHDSCAQMRTNVPNTAPPAPFVVHKCAQLCAPLYINMPHLPRGCALMCTIVCAPVQTPHHHTTTAVTSETMETTETTKTTTTTKTAETNDTTTGPFKRTSCDRIAFYSSRN